MHMGPTGDTVRENVAFFRELSGMTFAALSRRLEELGRPIPPLGLRRIEAGERRVDVDDLAALAVALNVNPNTLLFPRTMGDFIEARVTGVAEQPASRVWQWGRGWAPLIGQSIRIDAFREFVRPHVVLGPEERADARRRWVEGELRRIEEEDAALLATLEAEEGRRIDPADFDPGTEFLKEELRALDPEDDAAWAERPDDPAPPARGSRMDPRENWRPARA
ncbi:hypothetical protein GCM10010972_15240 [Cellulomonas carbonis]|nr:hypothetical protein GCM10010972_15240 [Cellulomonas carbonis]